MAAHRIRVLLLLVTTGGCAANQANPLGLNVMFGNADLVAAEPLFSKDEDRCLDSPVNLIRITQGEQGSSPAGAGFKVSCDEALKEWRIILKDARAKDNDVTKAKLTRNEVVDALLAASNRKCSRYTALIKNADGAVNGGLSVAAILTGGLGSFVGGAAAAKALSGTSAILTGSRTALNETYLSKQTIHVLASAFDKARQRQRAAITNRQACNIEQYTVMRGVEDAIAYHGTCSLVGGLAQPRRRSSARTILDSLRCG